MIKALFQVKLLIVVEFVLCYLSSFGLGAYFSNFLTEHETAIGNAIGAGVFTILTRLINTAFKRIWPKKKKNKDD